MSVQSGSLESREEMVTVEDPLEIRVSYQSKGKNVNRRIGITMRTPGADEPLVRGYLFTEGIIASFEDIQTIKYIDEHVIQVSLRNYHGTEEQMTSSERITTSSCGLCGKSGLEALEFESRQLSWMNRTEFSLRDLPGLEPIFRSNQREFEITGGLHAAALLSKDGKVVQLFEDVGRHNAMDKLIGRLLDVSIAEHLIFVSGRLSYELVMKGAMIGIPLMVAIGPPSSMAIELADREGMTLVGFLKKEGYNVYTHHWRIKKGH